MGRRYDPNTTSLNRDAEGPRAPREWLVGAGEMAEAIRSLDWSATPLGPRERWPESLRTVVNLLVASRFPMALLWGRELLLIYNDAYRVVAGGKHPAALGRSTREIWPEVWHLNEPIFAAVMDRGETVYLEDACFPINRHGFDEDAYFTLCYSPVRVDGGAVGGALVMLEETTARVAERMHAREAVRESTALLQAISDTSADVIFAKDRAGRMRFANPATLAVIGRTAAEVIGKTDAELLGDAAAARAVTENDRRIMERGVAEDVEERVPMPDGTHRIWFSRKSPLRDAAGEVVGLVGISRDITERKSAEEALRASEERYRALFANMTEGFAVGEPILDDAGVPRDVRFLEMNVAFERQTGLDIGRIRGRPLREVLPGLEPEWIETFGAVALSGDPVRFENYNRDLDRHFSVYCYQPTPGKFAIVFSDVTAKKRAEAASEREHELLTRLVDRLPVMITMYHPNLGGFRFNEEFKRVLGWREEDAASGDLMALAYPDPKVRAEAATHMRSLAPGWRELPVAAKDGTVVPSTWANLRLSDDTQVGIGIDLRERKRAEEAVREAEERLRDVVEDLPSGLIVADLSTRELHWNRAAFAIHGYDGTGDIHRFVETLIEDHDLRTLERDPIPVDRWPLPRLLAGETFRDWEILVRNVRLGRERVFSYSGVVIPAHGRMSATGLLAIHDITERKRAEEALREGEQRLRSVLDNMVEGLVIFDGSGNITHENPGSLRIHGRTLSGERRRLDQLVVNWRVRKYPDGAVVPPEQWAIPRVLRGERVQSERFFVDCIEDPARSFVAIYSGAPVHDARGKFAYGFLTIEDITEQARAEAALRGANERLRAIFEGTAVGMVEVDEEDRFVAVNGRFCAMLGYTRDELLGKRPHDITAPEDLARTRELNAKGHTGELEQFDYEKRYVRKDGTRIWVHVTVSVERDPSGRFVRAVGTAEDVTEQRRSREALRASEERWNAAIEHFSEGAIIATEDEQVIYWNPAARALHGFTTEREGLGPLAETPETFELWTPDASRLLPLDEWPMRRLKRGEPVRRMELRLRRPDQGWERTVSYSGAMVQTGGGEKLIFLSVTDLTEQRRAELALREADRRKDEFLGMLSHELRNPLAPIRNSLYILDRAEAGGQQARRAKEIANRQLAHLTRLVDDLLDVTRIARGKIELRRAGLDVAALARRAAEDHRQLMQDRHVDLVLDLPDDPVLVNGDETRLSQVFGNLLNNAAKFTPGGGRVTFSVGADGAHAVVRVRDTGAGLEPEMMRAIFEPFTQAKQTLARSEGGLGLGLALVKGLVALHGGDVAASSEGPGRGTEFVVTLPLASHRDRASATGFAPVAGAERRRVLVIDDNHDAADSLGELVSMMGHTVDVTYDALDGLARAADAMPDVVLCDIGLPGMDGYEFARQFRALASRPRALLVAVSGYAQPEDVARAVEAGFDAHVAKPPDLDNLAAVLGAASSFAIPG